MIPDRRYSPRAQAEPVRFRYRQLGDFLNIAKVWMREDDFPYFCALSVYSGRFSVKEVQKMKFSVKKMATLAMLAAVSYLLVFLVRIPVVMFLKYEPKDVAVTVGGFLFGPLSAFLVSLVVSLVEMVTISETGPIGALMNLLSTCSFACTAAFIYKKKRSLGGAIWGLAAGSVVMVAVMLLWNWLIPPYYMFQIQSPEDLTAARNAVEALLLPAFLPFNILKAGLNSLIVMAVYKPLVTALRRVGLLEQRPEASSGSRVGMFLFMGVLLITCILLILVLQGIL